MSGLTEGAVVQYSALGLKKVAKRHGQRKGKIVRIAVTGSVMVLWDGIKTAYALHPDYIEPLKETPMPNFNWGRSHTERRNAEQWMKTAKQDDKSLFCEGVASIKWRPGDRTTILDGEFTSAELRLIADHMDVVNAQ